MSKEEFTFYLKEKKKFILNVGKGEAKAGQKRKYTSLFLGLSLAVATLHFLAYTVLEHGSQTSYAGQFLETHAYLCCTQNQKLTSLKTLSKGKEVGLNVTCLGQPDFTGDSEWGRRQPEGGSIIEGLWL